MNKEDLKKLANNLFFDMSDEEYNTLSKEFEIILGQMDLIQKVEGIKEVKPLYLPFEYTNVKLREDVVVDSLDNEDILKNASKTECDMVMVPKVVE